jgi:thymidine kinase
MFAGKTQLLLELLAAAEARGERVIGVKPLVDARWPREIVSHSGARRSAVSVRDSEELLRVAEGCDLVGLDEAQFFDLGLAEALEVLRSSTRVVAAALDLDFRGDPFAVVPELIVRADVVHRLRAICGVCGKNATLTQRLVDGVPAPLDDAVIRVGGDELYSPRCARCYLVEREAATVPTG